MKIQLVKRTVKNILWLELASVFLFFSLRIQRSYFCSLPEQSHELGCHFSVYFVGPFSPKVSKLFLFFLEKCQGSFHTILVPFTLQTSVTFGVICLCKPQALRGRTLVSLGPHSTFISCPVVCILGLVIFFPVTQPLIALYHCRKSNPWKSECLS